MKTKLTDALLRSAPAPTKGKTTLTDTERVGLMFRITANNTRSWLIQKKVKGGKRMSITLGRYPAIGLAHARAEALRIELEARSGVDRVQVAKDTAVAEEAAAAQRKSVGEILDLYVDQHLRRALKPGPSQREREQQLRHYLEPILHTPIQRLTRADLQKIVDAKAAEGKLTMANRLRAALRAFTAWAADRDYLEPDPGLKVRSVKRERPRTRTPTIAEAREIWDASFQCGALWGPYFRLVILLGQRSREEILKMEWAWLDLGRTQLEIPDTKNRKPHIVHLPQAAVDELKRIRDAQSTIGLQTAFVFTTTGTTASSGVQKAKRRLDRHIRESREHRGEDPMPHWVLHDLRRAQATALAEAGFAEGVVDRIQNHQAVGSRPSQVAEVYNRAQLLDQRREALEYWAELVTRPTEEPSSLR